MIQTFLRVLFFKKEDSAANIIRKLIQEKKNNTKKIVPILIDSTHNVIKNEDDWLLESFIKIVQYLNLKEQEAIINFVEDCQNLPRKKTQEIVKKLKAMLE